MSTILTADLHLTDLKSDEYRWNLFEFLLQQSHDEIILAGDVTDKKDKHSSYFVNRLCDNLYKLSKKFKVYWLTGNHDCISPDNPFFRFIDKMDNLHYVTECSERALTIGKCLFIPSGFNWSYLDDVVLDNYKYIFTHVTYTGAHSDNGRQLIGVSPSVFENYVGNVYSGDIHGPQKVSKNIEYVGSPYPVSFIGDANINYRLLSFNDNGSVLDLKFNSISKRVVNIYDPEELFTKSIKRNDMIKVRCHLQRIDYSKWRSYKKRIKEIASYHEWLLVGPELIPLETEQKNIERESSSGYKSLEQLVCEYADKNNVNDIYKQKGITLINK